MIEEKNEKENIYNPELDMTVHKLSKHRLKPLRLKDVNSLRKARELKIEQYEQDAAIAAGIYANPPQGTTQGTF